MKAWAERPFFVLMIEKIRITFRSLSYRNFRLFLFGQGISVMGTWMQRVALPWLIYSLTGSAALLGVVSFLSYIPLLLFSPLAGVWVDRYDRMKILKITQFLAMAQALVLSFIVFWDVAEVWHILVLSFMLGTVNAFDVPGRQSFYIKLIDKKDDLANAIALNSIVFHISRFIGPSLAGIVIAVWGEAMCFFINALSYIAVLASLFAMRMEKEIISESATSFMEELREGFRYVSADPRLKNILLFIASISVFGWSYNVLLPVFAKDILGGGAVVFGLLTSSVSAGAIIGAVFVASRPDMQGMKKRSVIFAGIFGLALAAFAFSKDLYVSIFMLAIIGFAALLHHTSANSYFQAAVLDDKRGRALSFYALAHQGFMPLGGLYLGLMAERYGAPSALAAGGLFSLAVAIYFFPRLITKRNSI